MSSNLIKYLGAIYRKADQNLLVLMRGVSGSGKSTKARQFGGKVFSTDDYFMHGQHYVFDSAAIGQAHDWNQLRVEDAMRRGISPIVVDNTMTQAWEGKPYVDLALKYRYQIKISEPDSDLWKQFHPGMSDGQLMTLAQQFAERNVHGVPAENIFKMLKRWQPNLKVVDIMRSSRPQF